MTEGQLRYQTLMEDRRHNLAMEKYNSQQAQAALQNADIRAKEAWIKEKEAAINAYYRGEELKATKLHYSNETTLNARKAGAAIASSIFGGIGTIGALIA